MGKDDVIEVTGTVVDTLPNAKFKVKIEDENMASAGEDGVITAHLSGRMRMNYIKILPGDKVTLQMSVYDLTKGRITYRHKKERNSNSNPNPKQTK